MLSAQSIDRPPPHRAVESNMPDEIDAFIGRGREVARLRKLQSESRLLTLVGPSGVGKTRLALRLQLEVGDEFPDGTWLVDLSPITDPALVPQALGDVLGIRQQRGDSILGELARALRPRRMLLVLDNCEHLIAACAELIEGLLQACPNLRVLATSLQPLGSAAETTWRVPPLSVPQPDDLDLEAVQYCDAVLLFVSRVQAHMPDFAFDEHNAQVIGEICRRLDGLPLALELVAARVESLGVAEVAARLTNRFEIAVGASRTAPPRQRTLQAALDWSCSLLSDQELMLLRRLGVFTGGWPLAAAEAVCSDDALPARLVVDTLSQLVTKSLVVADHDGLTVRYRLLETVRAHALRLLANAGESEALHQRHLGFMLELVAPAAPRLIDTAVAQTLKREEDNLRSALEWAIWHDQAQLGLRLAAGALSVWLYSGHYVEGNNWLERLLELPSAAPAFDAHSDALIVDGLLLVLLSQYSLAHARCQSALAANRQRGNARGIGLSLFVLGEVALQRGDLAQADELLEDSLSQLLEARMPGAPSLLELGQIACELGDSNRARRLIAEVETIGRALHDNVVLAAAMHLRALVAAEDGAVTLAAQLLEQALAMRGIDQQGTVKSLTVLGHLRLDQGHEQVALDVFSEVLRRTRASGEQFWLIRALEGCARWLAASDAEAAVRLAGATDGQRQVLGTVPWPSERRYLEGWLERARYELGARAFERAWDDGHASTLAQAVSLAEALTIEPAASASLTNALTAREREVASLLAGGLTNKQIAASLVVSPATVRSHVEHILTKLEFRSRAQIAVWATQQGLVSALRPEDSDAQAR